MNKRYFLLLSFVLFSMPFLQTVSAATVADSIEKFATDSEPLLRLLLGEVSGVAGFSAGQILFVKLLVFILLMAIIYFALKRVPLGFGENKRISMLISAIVALLAVRFIVEGQIISFIWLPYGTLGIVLSSILPFIIAFFFFNGFDSTIIRRIGWISLAVIFGTLGYLRWGDLSLSNGGFNLAWAYVAIALISGGLVLYDRSMHKLIHRVTLNSEIQSITDVNKRVKAADVSHDIQELQNRLALNLTESQRSAVEHALREKQKALRSLLNS